MRFDTFEEAYDEAMTHCGYLAHMQSTGTNTGVFECYETEQAWSAKEPDLVIKWGPSKGGCGTYQGYQKHKRLGEEVCEPCRLARNEYMNAIRRKPEYRKRIRKYQRDRGRALSKLAEMFPVEYQKILSEVSRDES